MGSSLPAQKEPCLAAEDSPRSFPQAGWMDKEQIPMLRGLKWTISQCVCVHTCMMLVGEGWNVEDTKGLSPCIHKANHSLSELPQLAYPEQFCCRKVLSRDAENTARLLMAANKDLLHKERWDKDRETKSMWRTKQMRFCFCNNTIWNSSSQYKTSGKNVVVLLCPVMQSVFSPSF